MSINKLLSKKVFTGLALCWACALCILSCKKEDPTSGSSQGNRYAFEVPSNFPKATYTFDKNPITEKGFKLGKKLFYDPLLSRDGSVSCNNCHIQSLAFADAQQHPLSIGVNNRIGKRNAPPLTNLAFLQDFFWDGGVTHLDFVPINAIEADFEMDETMANVVQRLRNSEEYNHLFKEAFGTDSATGPYMLQALSQFMLMMVSSNSKYDKYVRNEANGELSQREMEGLQIFKAKCASCHSGDLFTDLSYRNNGINTSFENDKGRALITEQVSDEGKFRVPSLRNVARTSPYMHNAKFRTLDEVLDHYVRGVRDSPTLDPLLLKNGSYGIALSESDKAKVIEFLKTLSDFEFVADDRFFP